MRVTEVIADQQMAANSNVNKDIWGNILLNVKVFGAKGDGITNDAPMIQAVIDYAKTFSSGAVVYFPPGTYLINTPIVVNSDPLKLVSKITFQGAYGVPAYNSQDMPSIIKASGSFPANSPLLDLRHCNKMTVLDLSFWGIGGVTGTYGVELGERISAGRSFVNHRIDWCSFHNHQYGIKVANSSGNRITRTNVSGCYRAGIGLLQYCGDTDIEGNWINTNNVDYQGTDLLTGCGIIIVDGSNNVNIRGGKIEWNAKGVVIYGSVGTIIQGVNFDINKWNHITINPTGDGYSAAMGWTITGCRFLGGGTFLDSGGNGKCHIRIIAATGTTATGAITGNTLKKSGTDAYDNSTNGEIGPMLYGISIEGGGKIRVAISGNEMHDPAGVNTISASGPNIKVFTAGNSVDLASKPNSLAGGATITTG